MGFTLIIWTILKHVATVKYMTYISCVLRYLNPHLKQMKVAVAYILQSDTSVYCTFTLLLLRKDVLQISKDNNRSDAPESLGYFLPWLLVDFSPVLVLQTIYIVECSVRVRFVAWENIFKNVWGSYYIKIDLSCIFFYILIINWH